VGGRAFSLLEAVLATAMLGLATVMILSAVSHVWSAQTRQQQLLGAAEVANRVILIYMDDDQQLPPRTRSIQYGPHYYRWELRAAPVEVELPSGVSGDVSRRVNDQAMRYVRELRVRVWLSEENGQTGGSYTPTGRTPQVTVTRLWNPMVPTNPDSFRKFFSSQRFGEILGGP
jgi:type II secretory pathway pseudopilin PulG